MMIYTDRELQCRVCGRVFVFSAGEQQYFDRRGFQTPSRCPDCRVGLSRGGRAAHPRRRLSAGSEPCAAPTPPQPGRAWPLTCFRCGAQTEVPFLPREDALAYCPTCLKEVFRSLRDGRECADGELEAP